mmetsp:Transcript_166/g.325  ORF Transcript_166/g.325 Transcript_166/m.325 type:complete len:769 (-) Transcript_166:1192-3498(-)|eukprot:CAMPEP_0184650134 /NCGR_PEP_ID=MMETSP0308-20130426/7651_1 /TAXON_ID=38269 /ORGANISM="Gloeochaete witrockiana, Strain SAG 46.84" /LENGTH=768 /DNA_ID=CAMNT_0027083451 /DNA_START=16 /DNA_END=2322 /DNA_ORIENTATION=-
MSKNDVLNLYLCMHILVICIQAVSTFKADIKYRDEVRGMFDHAYHSYLRHGFPLEEVKPLSCVGRLPERRGNLDDLYGGYPLTLIEAAPTLFMLNRTEFERVLYLVEIHTSFDKDVTVSLFETTIRMLGGLLSIHMLATSSMDTYNNSMLLLAEDLGSRLLPAFSSRTGIPYSRVNLRRGVLPGESPENCLAGAGTLMLEFGLLSRLVRDAKYEEASRKATWALFSRKSTLDLIGKGINVETGQWTHPIAGIGAGSDSFYEYLVKAHILFGDKDMLQMFIQAYEAIMRNSGHEFFYPDLYIESGNLVSTMVDSLAAFWPAMQVLVGDIDNAQETTRAYAALWKMHKFLPERFDYLSGNVYSSPGSSLYPLRPELAESAFFLWQATHDDEWRQVGREMVHSLRSTRVVCGYATVTDVHSGTVEDRLDTYWFSETTKYLYMLFADDDELAAYGPSDGLLFTTEGHPILLHMLPPSEYPPLSLFQHRSEFQEHLLEQSTCAALPAADTCRSFKDYRDLTVLELSHVWSVPFSTFLLPPRPDLRRPHSHLHHQDHQEQEQQEQHSTLSPLPDKPNKISASPKFTTVKLPDGRVVQVQFLPLKNAKGQFQVLLHPVAEDQLSSVAEDQQSCAITTFYVEVVEPSTVEMSIPASNADFGPQLTDTGPVTGPLRYASPVHGCAPLGQRVQGEYRDSIVLVDRGYCTFARKAFFAQEVGAAAVIVVQNGEELFRMSDDFDTTRGPIRIPTLMISQSHADVLKQWLLYDLTVRLGSE